MRVKKLITLSAVVIALLGLIALGTVLAIKTQDNLKAQKLRYESKQTEIKELNGTYQKLDTELSTAEKETSSNESEIQRLEQERADLAKQKAERESQLGGQ